MQVEKQKMQNFYQEESSALVKAYVTSSVIDIIGELHGYQEGELAQTVNSDKAKNYTLEKEGYEVENISETKFKIKVDITKKSISRFF